MFLFAAIGTLVSQLVHVIRDRLERVNTGIGATLRNCARDQNPRRRQFIVSRSCKNLIKSGGCSKRGELELVLERYESAPPPIHIVHREGRHATAKVRTFVDMMIERLRGDSAIVGR
jgi:hypothetical protein